MQALLPSLLLLLRDSTRPSNLSSQFPTLTWFSRTSAPRPSMMVETSTLCPSKTASFLSSSKVVFYVFSPALVGTNVAQTITYDGMIKLWFMPVNILITFIVGSVLGWILIQLARPPPHLRGLILGCCAAGNLGNLLLIIIPAVCKEKGSPFGCPDVCDTYGMAYASLSMAIGAIYIWSYVYNIVRISSKRSTQDSPQSLKEPSESNQIEPQSKSKNCLVRMFQILNLKTIFAPSSIGAIVGFAIGVIPQIRKLMTGDGAPLRVILGTTNLLGNKHSSVVIPPPGFGDQISIFKRKLCAFTAFT